MTMSACGERDGEEWCKIGDRKSKVVVFNSDTKYKFFFFFFLNIEENCVKVLII